MHGPAACACVYSQHLYVYVCACVSLCRLRILKSFQLALDRFNMGEGRLPQAQPADFTDQDRHWLKLMAKMLRATQRESAAAAAAAAKGGKVDKAGGAASVSAVLLVTEQDVLDAMFSVKVRDGMDAVMVSDPRAHQPGGLTGAWHEEVLGRQLPQGKTRTSCWVQVVGCHQGAGAANSPGRA